MEAKQILLLGIEKLMRISIDIILPILLLILSLYTVAYFFRFDTNQLMKFHLLLGMMVTVCFVFYIYQMILNFESRRQEYCKKSFYKKIIHCLFIFDLTLILFTGIFLFLMRYNADFSNKFYFELKTFHELSVLFFPSFFLLEYYLIFRHKLLAFNQYLKAS